MLDAFLHLKRDILTRLCHTGNNDLKNFDLLFKIQTIATPTLQNTPDR